MLFVDRSRIGIIVRHSILSFVATMGLSVSVAPKYVAQALPDAVIVAMYLLAGGGESGLSEMVEDRSFNGLSPTAERLVTRYAWRSSDFDAKVITPGEWANSIPVLGSVCIDKRPYDSFGGYFAARISCGSADDVSDHDDSMCGVESYGQIGERIDSRIRIPGLQCGAGEVECRVFIDWIGVDGAPVTVGALTRVVGQPRCADPNDLAVPWEDSCESIVISAELNMGSTGYIWLTLQDIPSVAEADVACMMMAYEVELWYKNRRVGGGSVRYLKNQSNMPNWTRVPVTIQFRGNESMGTDHLRNPSCLRVTLSPSEAIAIRSGMRCQYINCYYELPVVIKGELEE